MNAVFSGFFLLNISQLCKLQSYHAVSALCSFVIIKVKHGCMQGVTTIKGHEYCNLQYCMHPFFKSPGTVPMHKP